jgi:hypothetical protein
MPLTIERRGATIGIAVPPQPDARDETGRALYIVDTAELQDLAGAQRELRDAWGLEPHGSVPDSETLMYFRPLEAGPTVEVPRVEWEALVQRVEELEATAIRTYQAEEKLLKRLEELAPVTVLPDMAGQEEADAPQE